MSDFEAPRPGGAALKALRERRRAMADVRREMLVQGIEKQLAAARVSLTVAAELAAIEPLAPERELQRRRLLQLLAQLESVRIQTRRPAEGSRRRRAG